MLRLLLLIWWSYGNVVLIVLLLVVFVIFAGVKNTVWNCVILFEIGRINVGSLIVGEFECFTSRNHFILIFSATEL